MGRAEGRSLISSSSPEHAGAERDYPPVALRRHLDHLHAIRPRVTGWQVLERDLSLHNDVLFSLLTVCQIVIDVAGELAARRGDRFEDYTEYVALDLQRVVEALDRLEPVERFAEIVRSIEA
jgi:uncharacterized protein YutE (UPF0331/DUF86 family)